MKKTELLAPAGNYECFLGAIHAGADAVYLGGSRFGARAYADNFSDEEIINAIKYAHVYGRKVYLTVNTLIKENEFSELYDYLKKFYHAGIDGIIIQDMGVFQAVGKWFPGLERHISTQMTVTGAYGAAYLKGLGATRIVPARELSLVEIKNIKNEVDIEIETFVHGAICYCYSGQCLFSSIIGGRSGNRGRCAQPCRLPYEIGFEESSRGNKEAGKKAVNKEQYPLSLKDMCTVELIPELISAGIDSFKIEGRMKSPEYVAGVTAIYRKYMDKYYENPSAAYHVDKRDMDMLRSLYIRSEISEGYYRRYNGRDMVTLDNPGYTGRDDALAQKIREKYLQGDYRLPVTGKVLLYKNNPAHFSVTYSDITAAIQGSVAEEALKQPMDEAGVRKQLSKSGNTSFVFKQLEIDMEPDVFIPVKALNDLRRMALEMLEEKIIERNGLAYAERSELAYPEGNEKRYPDEYENTKEYVQGKVSQTGKAPSINRQSAGGGTAALHVVVQTMDQLHAALKRKIQRIYISSDLIGSKADMERIFEKNPDSKKNIKFYLAMPYILRDYDKMFLDKMKVLLQGNFFEGVLIRNQEELQWLKEISYNKDIVTDANIYLWNREAYAAYRSDCKERYIAHELNLREIAELIESIGNEGLSQIAYGRIPMMVTANCISKTSGFCRKEFNNKAESAAGVSGFLKDRYRKIFPVYLNCRHCYNVIYNSVPLSLHNNIFKLKKLGISTFRLDFTTETEKETEDIIAFFEDMRNQTVKGDAKPPFTDYTNAHLNRGVE